jgi:acyl dehydratase
VTAPREKALAAALKCEILEHSNTRTRTFERAALTAGDRRRIMAQTGRPALYLEDLRVGQRFESGSHTLTAAEIKAFAAQFDPQPFHLDERAAADTLFKGLAASGWHTAAITMRLNVESGLPLAGGIIGAGVDLTWPAPARPGDTLHVENEVVELKSSQSKPDRGVVTLLSRTLNQRGEAVQIQTARLVVFRRAAS